MKANPSSWGYWHWYLRKQRELLWRFETWKVFQVTMNFPQFKSMMFDYERESKKCRTDN